MSGFSEDFKAKVRRTYLIHSNDCFRKTKPKKRCSTCHYSTWHQGGFTGGTGYFCEPQEKMVDSRGSCMCWEDPQEVKKRLQEQKNKKMVTLLKKELRPVIREIIREEIKSALETKQDET